MMNYLFIGDTHGDLRFVTQMAKLAASHNAEIIQVGDWGFIWPGIPDHEMMGNRLDELSGVLIEHGVTMRFIDGNHDWHEAIWKLAPGRFPTEIAPNVIYQPRGSTYVDPDGTKFLFMGGAASIDKDSRTDGLTWWATEEITEEDMKWAGLSGWADVVVSHDAPDYPPGFLPKGSSEFRVKSRRSMTNIKQLIDTLHPKLHVHGHWHHAYVNGVTRGLDCNYPVYDGDSYYLWSNA